MTTQWSTVGEVVLTVAAMCSALVALVRLGGQRNLAVTTTADIACVIALGAAIGRTALLAVPRLVSGLVALVSLFVAQRVLRSAGRHPPLARLRGPVVLYTHGGLHLAAMRRSGVTADDLRQQLRLRGIGRLDDVALVVLEGNAQFSVVQRDPGLDPWMLEDLRPPTPVGPRNESGRAT